MHFDLYEKILLNLDLNKANVNMHNLVNLKVNFLAIRCWFNIKLISCTAITVFNGHLSLIAWGTSFQYGIKDFIGPRPEGYIGIFLPTSQFYI